MRSLTAFFVLLIVFMAPGPLAHAQGTEPASKPDGSASAGATKEEVNQLRGEVAAQRKTIEELKAMVQQLAEAKTEPADGKSATVKPVAATNTFEPRAQPDNSAPNDGVHLVNTVLIQPAAEAPIINQAQPAAAPKKDAPLTAGWNGEHFFIRSADGQFQLMPYGYVDIDYRAYKGDGAPADTFVVRRARFGFQGNYGSHFDYAILTDANSTTGAIVRDVYLNVGSGLSSNSRRDNSKSRSRRKPELAQPTSTSSNADCSRCCIHARAPRIAAPAWPFTETSIGGVIQWWAGAFNGRNGVDRQRNQRAGICRQAAPLSVAQDQE